MTDFVGVPITHRGAVLGNLFLAGRREGRFTAADRRALETIAGYAGVAIANAQLYERAQSLAVVEERTRVARELHDAASQRLFSLVYEAHAAGLRAGTGRRRGPGADRATGLGGAARAPRARPRAPPEEPRAGRAGGGARGAPRRAAADAWRLARVRCGPGARSDPGAGARADAHRPGGGAQRGPPRGWRPGPDPSSPARHRGRAQRPRRRPRVRPGRRSRAPSAPWG